jgi:hypothetical protein
VCLESRWRSAGFASGADKFRTGIVRMIPCSTWLVRFGEERKEHAIMRADDIFVEEAQQDPAKFAVEVFLEICYQKARQDP